MQDSQSLGNIADLSDFDEKRQLNRRFCAILTKEEL